MVALLSGVGLEERVRPGFRLRVGRTANRGGEVTVQALEGALGGSRRVAASSWQQKPQRGGWGGWIRGLRGLVGPRQTGGFSCLGLE
ncbi:hypothetical protein GCM10008019_20880 [Deinococcus soli (ex Cha et al. 2016)]|nr:hypothetical protein GCM10008019_20880 [Deinococcus soli (ex Cha et al. 2016)]